MAKKKKLKGPTAAVIPLENRRSRKERRGTEVYRLEPLFDEESREELSNPDWGHIEGSLDGYVIVSVPLYASRAFVQEMRSGLIGDLKRPVIVITHNVKFLKSTKLSSSEAAQVFKEVDDYGEARRSDQEKIAQLLTQSDNSSGDRSRLREAGDRGDPEGNVEDEDGEPGSVPGNEAPGDEEGDG